MPDNTQGRKQGFVGELTEAEIRNDRKANATQDTRPSIVVDQGLRALRKHGGTQR